MDESISWGELAELTHSTQVEKFNWCACEEQEQFPYEDCPRELSDRDKELLAKIAVSLINKRSN